jgi:hypothetical protein
MNSAQAATIGVAYESFATRVTGNPHVGSDNLAFEAAWDAMTQRPSTDCGN